MTLSAVQVSFVTKIVVAAIAPLPTVSSVPAQKALGVLFSRMRCPIAWRAVAVDLIAAMDMSATLTSWRVHIVAKMIRAAITFIIASCALLLACQANSNDGASTQTIRCQHDAQCVYPWHPGRNGCVPQSRCVAGQCIAPAAESGLADTETGVLHFESNRGRATVQVEIADDNFERARGLMCRTSMKQGWGMLFIMPTTQIQAFWMKNTLIPLDMIFIDEHWTIVGMVENVPQERLETSRVDRPSKYVLELGAGEANRLGLFAGQIFRFQAPPAQTLPNAP